MEERVTVFGLGASVFTLLLVSGLFFSLFILYNLMALVGRRPRSREQAARGDTVFLPLYLREFWDWVIAPVVGLLVRLKIHPDVITWWSVAFAAGAGAAFAVGYFGLGGWLYVGVGTCDMLDGKVARATNTSTRAGAFIDSTLDRYTEILVLAGLAWFFRDSPVLWAAIFALAGSLMVSYTRARGEGLGVSCREGGMQRAERIVYLGVGGIIGKVIEAIWQGTNAARIVVGAAVVLIAVSSNITAVQRFLLIVRALREEDARSPQSEKGEGRPNDSPQAVIARQGPSPVPWHRRSRASKP